MKKTSELKTYPKWLVRLQNEIAGNLPGKQSKDWTARLLNAVETNTNLEDCKHRFLARLLRECLGFDRDAYPKCAKAIDAIAELHDRWQDVDKSAWYAARSAARSTAWSTRSAAWSAWYAAESAASSAARYAMSAAKSARSAAWSAWSAWSEAAAESARYAMSAAWSKIADILLEEVER